MNHMINIGNENRFDERSYKGLVTGVVDIFAAAEKHHIDEVTTRKALDILTELSSVKNVNVSNSSFVSNPVPIVADMPSLPGEDSDSDDSCDYDCHDHDHEV